MPQLDWKHYTLIALALAALTAWGSRERSWSKTTEQYQTEQTRMTKSLAQLRTENESLQRSIEEVVEIVPVQMPNGQIAYTTRKTSKTVETAMRSATEQLNSLTTQVTDLKVKLSLKETETIKSAPRWYVGVDWQPLKGTALAAFMPEAGINIGTLTIKAGHPLELKFDAEGRPIIEPHVGLGFRF